MRKKYKRAPQASEKRTLEVPRERRGGGARKGMTHISRGIVATWREGRRIRHSRKKNQERLKERPSTHSPEKGEGAPKGTKLPKAPQRTSFVNSSPGGGKRPRVLGRVLN